MRYLILILLQRNLIRVIKNGTFQSLAMITPISRALLEISNSWAHYYTHKITLKNTTKAERVQINFTHGIATKVHIFFNKNYSVAYWF